jgi:DNA gyrase/topoisomerase IV subunit A
MKFSLFCTTKDGMVVPTTLDQLARRNKSGMTVKYIRLDNAGENVKLQKVSDSKDYKMILQFEFTACYTSQQNHLALINRGRAMMRLANIPKNIRYKVFPMVFETATLLDSLVMCTIDGETKTCAEHFGKTLPKFAKYLRT